MAKFVKGQVAWNKNRKGLHLSPKSEWKAGDTVGKKSKSWKGGIQNIENDCVYVWQGANQRKRRPEFVWEKAHGKGSIKVGMVIYHKNLDSHDDTLENLELITRAELLRRNLKRKAN